MTILYHSLEGLIELLRFEHPKIIKTPKIYSAVKRLRTFFCDLILEGIQYFQVDLREILMQKRGFRTSTSDIYIFVVSSI